MVQTKLRIGLTGGIGSGKSTVARVFHSLGVPVFDADNAAKKIMNEDESVHKELGKYFGKKVFENGKLNRTYLSEIVFNNKEKLNLLNQIVHPATIREAEKWMNEQKTFYAIKEAALLFEANSAKDLDVVVGVYSPLETRISRVMQRNNLSRKQVLERIHKQMNEEEKMRLCDYVIYNNEKELLIPQVLDLHHKFSEVV